MSPPRSSTCAAKRRSSTGCWKRRGDERQCLSRIVSRPSAAPTRSVCSRAARWWRSVPTSSSCEEAAVTERCSSCRRLASAIAMGSELSRLTRALWRSVRFGYSAAPRLFLATFALSATAWLPQALTALWLKQLADAAVSHRTGLVAAAAAAIGTSVALSWLLNVGGARLGQVLRLRTGVAIQTELSRLQAKVPGIEHQELPEFLDRLQILKDHVFLLDHFYGAFMGVVGLVLLLLVTVGLLASIHPALALLILFAVPAATAG